MMKNWNKVSRASAYLWWLPIWWRRRASGGRFYHIWRFASNLGSWCVKGDAVGYLLMRWLRPLLSVCFAARSGFSNPLSAALLGVISETMFFQWRLDSIASNEWLLESSKACVARLFAKVPLSYCRCTTNNWRKKTTKKNFCEILLFWVVLYQVVILLYPLLFFLINIRYEALFFGCLSHKNVHVCWMGKFVPLPCYR